MVSQQGAVDMVAARIDCKWPWLALYPGHTAWVQGYRPWLPPGRPILTLASYGSLAAMLGAMVGNEWANSHPGCMNGLSLVGSSFLAEKTVWSLNVCLPGQEC